MLNDDDELTGSMLLLAHPQIELDHDFSVKVSEVAYTRAERAVLRQIIFWFPKAKHVRNGKIWLVKSAGEFREEGIDFAEGTIRRAIRALVEREVIVTTKHFHPFRAVHGPVNFIRPAKEVIDDYAKKERKMAPW